MELLFDNPFGNEYDKLLPLYRELAAKTFAKLKVRANYEIDVSLVDEETIQTINRDYRKIDRVTDVISFAFNDDTDPRDQINGEKTLRMLGEILICLPQAKRQAADIGNSEKRELSFLFVHGLLHLLGYDHQTKEEEETMFALQEEILDGGREMPINETELVQKAQEAMALSYSPYSHFPVGAAILCSDGTIYLGANVENSSFPCGICAERNAIYHAMMEGKSKDDFLALAIITDTDDVASPCGLCRQVISELFPSDGLIYLANTKGDIRSTNIEELLPFAFNGDEL